MAAVLVVVDRPFRGVLERQFADAVHLARVCAMQFESVTVLLTGEGVLLSAAAPGAAGVPAAEVHTTANLHAAAATGITLLVDAAAATTFGLPAAQPPFEPATAERIVHALTTHDHVWYA